MRMMTIDPRGVIGTWANEESCQRWARPARRRERAKKQGGEAAWREQAIRPARREPVVRCSLLGPRLWFEERMGDRQPMQNVEQSVSKEAGSVGCGQASQSARGIGCAR